MIDHKHNLRWWACRLLQNSRPRIIARITSCHPALGHSNSKIWHRSPRGGGQQPAQSLRSLDSAHCPNTSRLPFLSPSNWVRCDGIFGKEPKVSFGYIPLVLCHMDLTPRNIMELSDGSICILDWASARFYPHVFEVAMLQLNPFCKNEDKLIEPLLQHGISIQEPTQLAQVINAWGNCQRFHM